MKNSLPNSNVKYDSSKLNEMDMFLKHIYKIAKSNPSMYISDDIIYSQLKHNNLKKSEKNEYGKGINCREYFSKWEYRFKNKNVDAFCDEIGWPYWFQFVNGNAYNNEYIKLYIPLDYDHLLDGATMIFSFLDKENITHLSKIGSEMRVDNVIIRLNKGDYEALDKILNYINNNDYIKNGLNKCNPFIPTIGGIGVMKEHGNSYNMDISGIISSYIMMARKNGLNDVNINSFRSFLRVNSYDQDLINTFEIAYAGKDNNLKNNNSLTTEQKYSLFIDSIKATYKKYGYSQVYRALVEIIKLNNYSYISNGNTSIKLRNNLMSNVSNYEIKNFVFESIKNIYPNYKLISVERTIEDYLNVICSDKALFEFEEISSVTLENRGEKQLIGAIYHYLVDNNSEYFSRYIDNNKAINYRERLKYINRFDLINLIKRSLNIRGVNTDKLNNDELINIYAKTLNNSLYENMEERPKIIK